MEKRGSKFHVQLASQSGQSMMGISELIAQRQRHLRIFDFDSAPKSSGVYLRGRGDIVPVEMHERNATPVRSARHARIENVANYKASAFKPIQRKDFDHREEEEQMFVRHKLKEAMRLEKTMDDIESFDEYRNRLLAQREAIKMDMARGLSRKSIVATRAITEFLGNPSRAQKQLRPIDGPKGKSADFSINNGLPSYDAENEEDEDDDDSVIVGKENTKRAQSEKLAAMFDPSIRRTTIPPQNHGTSPPKALDLRKVSRKWKLEQLRVSNEVLGDPVQMHIRLEPIYADKIAKWRHEAAVQLSARTQTSSDAGARTSRSHGFSPVKHENTVDALITSRSMGKSDNWRSFRDSESIRPSPPKTSPSTNRSIAPRRQLQCLKSHQIIGADEEYEGDDLQNVKGRRLEKSIFDPYQEMSELEMFSKRIGDEANPSRPPTSEDRPSVPK